MEFFKFREIFLKKFFEFSNTFHKNDLKTFCSNIPNQVQCNINIINEYIDFIFKKIKEKYNLDLNDEYKYALIAYLGDENYNINCENCENCYMCMDCTDCKQCYFCYNSLKCNKCTQTYDTTKSQSLFSCFNCERCKTCNYLNNCKNCVNCDSLSYATSCYGCTNCNNCIKCKDCSYSNDIKKCYKCEYLDHSFNSTFVNNGKYVYSLKLYPEENTYKGYIREDTDKVCLECKHNTLMMFSQKVFPFRKYLHCEYCDNITNLNSLN